MAGWIEVADEDDVEEVVRVEHDGKAYALFRLESGFHALDDICSHEYSRLSEGELWDDEVYCPKHGSRFDIRTGEVRSLPAFRPVSTYPVKVENGKVLMQIGDE